MKTCICIVGMHRGGTSAVTRVLNLLGVDLGEPQSLMPPHPVDNPTGYWEMEQIEKIQRRILAGLGTEDVSPAPLPEDWRERASTIHGMVEIRELVERCFESREQWGFKDPRTAILLPIWQEVLGGIGVDQRYVIVLRNPLHVAASEGRRSHITNTHPIQFAWHYYMLSALHHTRGARRAVVSYHELLRDWRETIRRAAKRADLPLDVDASPRAAREIDDFLRPTLERSAGGPQEDWAADFVRESFELVSTIARDGEARERDKQVAELLEAYISLAGGVLRTYIPWLDQLNQRVRELQAEGRRARAEHELLQEKLIAMEASWSWKVTAPLRAVFGLPKSGR